MRYAKLTATMFICFKNPNCLDGTIHRKMDKNGSLVENIKYEHYLLMVLRIRD